MHPRMWASFNFISLLYSLRCQDTNCLCLLQISQKQSGFDVMPCMSRQSLFKHQYIFMYNMIYTFISLPKSLCSLCVAFRSLHVMLLLIPGRAFVQRTSSMLSMTRPLIDTHNSSTILQRQATSSYYGRQQCDWQTYH